MPSLSSSFVSSGRNAFKNVRYSALSAFVPQPNRRVSFSFFHRYHFRCVFCSPLAEQMSHLEPGKSALFRKVRSSVPVFRIPKVKDSPCFSYHPPVVTVVRSFPISVSSGRVKQRGEDHIYPTFCSCAHKVSDDFPVVFTEHRNLVIICQTVTVKTIPCGSDPVRAVHTEPHGSPRLPL